MSNRRSGESRESGRQPAGLFEALGRTFGSLSRLTPLLHGLFLLVLALAPLPLASNREWSWGLCALLIGIITALWALTVGATQAAKAGGSPLLPPARGGLAGRVRGFRRSYMLGVALGFLLVIAWALFQASPNAPADWMHPLWQMSAEVLGRADTTQGFISLAPDDSYTAVMRLLCYGLVFYLAFQWGRDEHLARRTLQAIVLAALAYAVFGLYQYWSGSNTLFWFESSTFNRSLHSTFINRNHYATYAGLALLCALGLFYHRMARHASQAPRVAPGGRIPRGAKVTTATDRLERFAVLAWKPLLAILVLTTALVLTHSRGGFFSALAGAGVLLLCLQYRRPVRNKGSLAVIVAAGGIAAVSFWLTSEVLLERLDTRGLSDNLRFSAYELIRESSGDSPVLGFGYGTFDSSFRLYRSEAITGYLDRAHNTYLENIFELGWPAALLLFGVVGACGLLCLRGLRSRGKDWVYPAIGVSATVLVGIHAYFDFSLQMPAVAMTYAAILGVACAQSFSSRL